jgi:hypothetical protein
MIYSFKKNNANEALKIIYFSKVDGTSNEEKKTQSDEALNASEQ